MSQNLTDRQERFAQMVAAGSSLSDAYRANYNCQGWKKEAIWENASKLGANAKVAPRIAELRAEMAAKTVEKVSITKADVLEILLDNARMMRKPQLVPDIDDEGNPTTREVDPSPAHIQAANRAIELIGKELGMFIDRKEIKTGRLDNMTRDELEREARALAERLNLPPPPPAPVIPPRVGHKRH